MTPKDQLREKVEKALEGCDFVVEVGAVDNVLTLLASSTKEAVETCVRAVEAGSYNQDGTCRSCYKHDNVWSDGKSACEGADMMDNIRNAAVPYLE